MNIPKLVKPFAFPWLTWLLIVFQTLSLTGQNPRYEVETPGHVLEGRSVELKLIVDEVGGGVGGPVFVEVNGRADSVRFSDGAATLTALPGKNGDLQIRIQPGDRYIEANVHILPAWLSVVPPLLAIILALLIREVILSLFVGIFSGLLLMYGFTPAAGFTAFLRFVDHHLITVISDTDHLAIIVFSLLIGGMVSVISRNGGMTGLVSWLKRYARNRKRTLLLTWFLGILIFFDDYANTLIVGNTMRPLTDRFRISRQKLAYVVDSTAAPIASVAFITTWIGAQLDYIQGAVDDLPIDEGAYGIFLNSLPYAFYPVFTLIFMLMIIISGKDFGPMKKAEDDARERHVKAEKGGSGDVNGYTGNPWTAVVPVLILITVAFGSLFYTGYSSEIWAQPGVSTWRKLAEIIGRSDAYRSLLWASMTSLSAALLMTWFNKRFRIPESMGMMIEGFKTMLHALVILVLAWVLADITGILGTANFMAETLKGSIMPQLLPALVFLLAAFVSFATGSSWGTMAILYPVVLPLAYITATATGLDPDTVMQIFYMVTSVVLAGAVFGDHCSPISDTTILSSLASGCSHIEHVRTQLPYALTVGFVSLATGYLLSAFQLIPLTLSYLAGIFLLALIVFRDAIPIRFNKSG